MRGLGALLLLLALVVAGTAAAAAQEITFWVMPNAPDAIHVPWLQKKAEECHAETGIRVHFEVIGWDVGWSRISTAIITGDGGEGLQVATTLNPTVAA